MRLFNGCCSQAKSPLKTAINDLLTQASAIDREMLANVVVGQVKAVPLCSGVVHQSAGFVQG
jgi:hypothetical protein